MALAMKAMVLWCLGLLAMVDVGLKPKDGG